MKATVAIRGSRNPRTVSRDASTGTSPQVQPRASLVIHHSDGNSATTFDLSYVYIRCWSCEGQGCKDCVGGNNVVVTLHRHLTGASDNSVTENVYRETLGRAV